MELQYIYKLEQWLKQKIFYFFIFYYNNLYKKEKLVLLMKTIKVESWKAKSGETEVEESILSILTVLLSNKNPNDLPKGFQKAMMFHRIITAFSLAEKTKELLLDDIDYEFLKKLIDTEDRKSVV